MAVWLLDNKAARAENHYNLAEKKPDSIPKRDCKEMAGRPLTHGHLGFTLLLDKKVKD